MGKLHSYPFFNAIKFIRCSTDEQVARLLTSTEVKTYPGHPPTGLLFSETHTLKDFLRKLPQKLQSLQGICKITIRRTYGGNHENWLKTRFALPVWNSGILYTTTRTLDNKAIMMLNGDAN